MEQEGFKRKLTAILSADAVGYSRLMGDDEASTVKTLNTYKEIMNTLIQQHRGRVVDSLDGPVWGRDRSPMERRREPGYEL